MKASQLLLQHRSTFVQLIPELSLPVPSVQIENCREAWCPQTWLIQGRIRECHRKSGHILKLDNLLRLIILDFLIGRLLGK